MDQDQATELLRIASQELSSPSPKTRVRIFQEKLLPIVDNRDLSLELATSLVEVIFQTLPIYDDRPSRMAVDRVITKALQVTTFMKSFAAVLVQSMERQSKSRSMAVGYRLLKWSCLLLQWSRFATASKGGVVRLSIAQGSLCQVLDHVSLRRQRIIKRLFSALFSKSIDLFKIYMESITRIYNGDSLELINMLLEHSICVPSLFDENKFVFLDLYVNASLNAKERPPHALGKSFKPLLQRLGHEDFQNLVFPSTIKMLKRNPEIVLESVGYLLQSLNLDLSKYASEFLSVILPQARYTDEERRVKALIIVGHLSEKSSDPDVLSLMFDAVKAIIGGSEGKLALPYQRIGMINVIQELSKSPGGEPLTKLAPSVADFLLSCYKDEGSEEVKLAILSALASWASRSAEAMVPGALS